MLKRLLTFCLALTLVACSNNVGYERSTKPGTVQEITMDDVLEKIENKETFMFVFTQTTCSNCQAFKENVLDDYIKNHEIEFNEVVLSIFMETAPVIEWVKEHPNPADQLEEGFTETDILTPSFYFIENGEVKDIYIGGAMTKSVLEEMVIKYRLDEVK